MTLHTLVSLIRNRQLPVLLSITRAVRGYHRLAFVASGLSSGLLRRLATGPVPLHRLAPDDLPVSGKELASSAMIICGVLAALGIKKIFQKTQQIYARN